MMIVKQYDLTPVVDAAVLGRAGGRGDGNLVVPVGFRPVRLPMHTLNSARRST